MHALLSLDRTFTPRRRLRKRTLSMQVRVGTMTLMMTLITLICVLSIAHLLHANNIQTRGYQIRQLEQERASLLIEHKALTMTVTQAESLDSIKQSEGVARMVAVENPLILNTNSPVALK